MALIDYAETGKNDEWLEAFQDAVYVTNLMSCALTAVRFFSGCIYIYIYIYMLFDSFQDVYIYIYMCAVTVLCFFTSHCLQTWSRMFDSGLWCTWVCGGGTQSRDSM